MGLLHVQVENISVLGALLVVIVWLHFYKLNKAPLCNDVNILIRSRTEIIYL